MKIHKLRLKFLSSASRNDFHFCLGMLCSGITEMPGALELWTQAQELLNLLR